MEKIVAQKLMRILQKIPVKGQPAMQLQIAAMLAKLGAAS